jgi:hypothetical protein
MLKSTYKLNGDLRAVGNPSSAPEVVGGVEVDGSLVNLETLKHLQACKTCQQESSADAKC